MVCLPLIERELRVALRKLRPAQTRFKVAASAAGGSVLFVLFGALTGARGIGGTLEQILCAAGLYFVLRVPALTAGVLADERQNQTLGLLFLSGLGSWQVFASKFLSAATLAFTNLLAIFPMLALPFLLGGVSFDVFVATICLLPVLMFFSLAISLLGSVLARDDGAAVVLSAILGGSISLLTVGIYLGQSHFAPQSSPSRDWLIVSPAYGPFVVWNGLQTGLSPAKRAELWQNLGVTICWSILALALAAWVLDRIWRDQVLETQKIGWRKKWSDLVHGSLKERTDLALLWLHENPYVWLAGRDRQPAFLGWLVIGGGVVLWLICWGTWRHSWPSVPNFFLSASLMNLALAWLIRYSAARELGRARCDGSYELLLTTPLEPRQIVLGTLEVLRSQFRPLANCVLVLSFAMILGGLVMRAWSAGALLVYFIVWFVLLCWSWSLGYRITSVLPVMWISLNCGRPAFAVWRGTGFNGWSFFWVFFNLRNLRTNFGQFPSGSILEIILVCFFALIWSLAFFRRASAEKGAAVHQMAWDPIRREWRTTRLGRCRAEAVASTRLVAEFREITREPVPDSRDPRFKKWNVRERFPWGWELVQQQLHERLARRPRNPG
jgi:ABC-type transport system involved in multi-copper enzyme maturation permease subunit